MENIFSYSDYRKYIKDYYDFHKSQKDTFSYRVLALRAGINSAPFFKFLIEGKRNLTRDTIVKVGRGLRLDEKEQAYFENLVYFNQARTLEEKNRWFDKLIALQKERPFQRIEEEQYEYFAEWYHCVIRELITEPDFNGDFQHLARRVVPAISSKEAEQSAALLVRLGFLKEENGRYVQTEPVVTSGNAVRSHRVVQFQIKMLQRAIEAYERTRVEERLMSSTTLHIAVTTFDHMKEKIREFRRQLLEFAKQDDKADKVYQLNLNFFPLSREAS